MAHNLPPKLSMAESRALSKGLEDLVRRAQVDYDADESVVRLELAMICARFAVNAGVLDWDRLPVEERYDREDASSPVAAGAGEGGDRGAVGGGAAGAGSKRGL